MLNGKLACLCKQAAVRHEESGYLVPSLICWFFYKWICSTVPGCPFLCCTVSHDKHLFKQISFLNQLQEKPWGRFFNWSKDVGQLHLILQDRLLWSLKVSCIDNFLCGQVEFLFVLSRFYSSVTVWVKWQITVWVADWKLAA